MTEKKLKTPSKGLLAKVKSIPKRTIVKIIILANALNFLIPLVWATISIHVVYSGYDAVLGYLLTGFAFVYFFFAYYLIANDKSMLYTLGLLAGLIPLYVALGLWTVYHFVLAVANIVAIILLIKVNKGRNKLLPRFKSNLGKMAIPFLILALLVPILSYFVFQSVSIPVEIEDNSKDSIEINWMWAEIWELDQDLVDALAYCDGLENVDISIMVGLPEDIMTEEKYTQFIIQETGKLDKAGITWDFMPLLPLDEDGDPNTNDYGYDGLYINDITIDRYMETIDIFKDWVVDNDLADKFRVICIDTELYWEKRNELYFQWWPAYETHAQGAEKLQQAIDEFKEVEGDHPVVSATFGMHLDDFVDFDDAQLQMMQMSAFPPWNWDGVGVMIYETGYGSDYSIYSSCNAMRYYLGDASIPYIITAEGDTKNPTAEDLSHITTKFKIIKNMGFEYTGAWALTDFLYYFSNYSKRDDYYGKARVPGGTRFTLEQFIQLHQDINDHQGKLIVYYQTFNHSAVHFALQYVDIWLFNRFTYDGMWPKIKKLPTLNQ